MSTNFELHTAVPDPMSKSQFEALLRNLIPQAEVAGDGLTVAANKLLLDLVAGGGLDFSGGQLGIDFAAAGIGRVLQVVVETDNVRKIVDPMPIFTDYTIDEGEEVLSLAITPKLDNSRIFLLASPYVFFTTSVIPALSLLFQEGTANYLIANTNYAHNSAHHLLMAVVTVSDTSEQVFKVKSGNRVTSTSPLCVNRESATFETFRNVHSWIIAMEVNP